MIYLEPQQTSGKEDKRGQSSDYKASCPLDVWSSCSEVCQEHPCLAPGCSVWQSHTKASQLSQAPLLSPSMKLLSGGNCPAIPMQSLGSPYWSFLNTHSKVCQNSGFVLLLQSHTKSWFTLWNFQDLIYLLCDKLCYIEVKPHTQMIGSIIQ